MNKKSRLLLTIAGIFITVGAQTINYIFNLSDTAFGIFMGIGIGLLLLPVIKNIDLGT